jgi:hypothetical protein
MRVGSIERVETSVKNSLAGRTDQRGNQTAEEIIAFA